MKKLLRIIILTIITSFIFSSCSNKFSITKRKYNKGYYVSHSHKKHEVKEQKTSIPVNETTEPVETIVVKPTTPVNEENEKDASLSASASKPADENSSLIKNTSSSNLDLALNKKYYKVKQLERLMPSTSYSRAIKNNLSAHSSDDALSLLWIVIVIVLLLYLFGLLFGGFGLGGAIHVLAVIFLVLLILWLLRVI